MSARAGLRTMLLAAGAALLAAASASATPTCTAPARLIQYPLPNPVWEFCMTTPDGSSTTNGSGLELTNAFYNNHQVLKRAHAPILNVKYLPGGCGGSQLCYRDWSFQEVRFEAIGPNGPVSSGPGGYTEVVLPARTVCETGGGTDVGSFNGVTAERLSDHLVLTTQFAAGWYRYAMRWMFYLDGSFTGWFGFSAVTDPCVNFSHTHHNYWRLDFDIDGAAADSIEKIAPTRPPQGLPPPRPQTPFGGLESTFASGGRAEWRVRDTVTGRGYEMHPGSSSTVDTFAVSDYWFLTYKANEMNDSGQVGPACAIKIGGFMSSEPVTNADIVMWIRGGQFHEGGDLDDCHSTYFTFEPVGNWAPAQP